MPNKQEITVVGNLTADPELRYTQNGLPVANFTVAFTPRTFDRQSNEWKDGEAIFFRCSVWREFAEQVAQSLVKGNRVIVTGELKNRSYQDREGQNRTSLEVEVDEIGPSLRYAVAQVMKVQKGQGGAPQGQPQQGGYQGQPQQGWPAADEPWATPTGQPQQGQQPPQQGRPQFQPQQGQQPAQGQPQGQPQQPPLDPWQTPGSSTQYGEDTPF